MSDFYSNITVPIQIIELDQGNSKTHFRSLPISLETGRFSQNHMPHILEKSAEHSLGWAGRLNFIFICRK